MYIIDVTPFSKSIKTDSLSYFSTTYIKSGSIVSVPLRNKMIKGLVTGSKSATDMKSELRSSEFTLKKIKSVAKNFLFKKEFIEATQKTAEFYATSIGSIIQALIPENVIEDVSGISLKINESNKEETHKATNKLKNILPDDEENQASHPKYILQNEDKDRYAEYRSIIREQFARNKSVMFCVPTVEDGNFALKELSRGIDRHTFFLNSKLKKSEIIKVWKEIIERDKPSLIVITGGFVGIPIDNLGIIIVERENSISYKTKTRPYFDLRRFFENYAEALNTSLMYGDLMLRAETLMRYDQHEFIEHTPIKFRSVTDATQKIINMKDNFEVSNQDFSISKTLERILMDSAEKNERFLLLTNRKGLSPTLICADCGTVVNCSRCSAGMVLYGIKNPEDFNLEKSGASAIVGTKLQCRACGLERPTDFICTKCGSWKLRTLGIGTEKVVTEVQKILPKTKILILDKEHVKTAENARKVVAEFYDSPHSVLVATEMALLYLHEQIENVAIISIDSLFNLPDFRIRERIVNIMLRARALASQEFLIQTRISNDQIFKNITEGNLMDFYRKEFVDRKKFNYPPFSLIIKFSLAGKNIEKINYEYEKLKEILAPNELITYPGFIQVVRGQKIVHGMIKIPRNSWPDEKLVKKIKQLPPQFKIEIDAESVI